MPTPTPESLVTALDGLLRVCWRFLGTTEMRTGLGHDGVREVASWLDVVEAAIKAPEELEPWRCPQCGKRVERAGATVPLVACNLWHAPDGTDHRGPA